MSDHSPPPGGLFDALLPPEPTDPPEVAQARVAPPAAQAPVLARQVAQAPVAPAPVAQAVAASAGTSAVPRADPARPLRRRASAKRRYNFGWNWPSVLAVFLVLLMAGFLATTVYAREALKGLPAAGLTTLPVKSIVVYDRNGQVLAERNQNGGYQESIKLPDMGHWAPAATLAAEDRDFFSHGALNPLAVARAVVTDTMAHRPIQGGSTITQQLVKIELLKPHKSFGRKLQEAVLANELEKKYSKDEILQMYLNRVYYGHGAYGIAAATRTYFGSTHNVKDLDPAEAAFLAGLINSPTHDDPQTHFDRARSRQTYVLKQMLAAHQISQAEYDQASAKDIQKELVYDTSFREEKAPHFVDYVVSKVESQFGSAAVQQGGFAIYTTIDPNLQRLAEDSVRSGVRAMAGKGVNNGMLLAASPNSGEILAWVGSVDYRDPKVGGAFDVILSPRQPGSSFKPYVYEAALHDHKIALNTCLHDVPTDFNGYRPLDYDNRYMGDITARQALVESRNIPAVEVARTEGMQGVINLAGSMGIESKLPPYLSTAIGAGDVTMLEHLQGYQVFADEGHRVPLVSITKVVYSNGDVLFQQAPGKQQGQADVLPRQDVYLLTDTLKAYQDRWQLGWQRRMAGKSGTSGSSKVGVHQDAWMMAYNHDIVVGAWAGNSGSNGAGGAISAFGVNTGSTILAPFINGLPATWNHWYAEPQGLLHQGGELFLPGTEHQAPCHQAPPGDGGGGGGDSGGGGDGD